MHARYDELKTRGGRFSSRGLLVAFASSVALGAACSDEESSPPQCIGGDGAVAGASAPLCQSAQDLGECVSGVDAAEEEEHEHDESADAGAEEHEHDEEEHATNYGREADDDECKYHVSFTNTCVAVNEPVTFTLSLTRLIDGLPAGGTNPAFPEIYLADDPSHLSPSNDITAREGAAGVYEIGPIVFDQSGRWIVRFHYFETCSEIPEDSPHSHAAFYIDVP